MKGKAKNAGISKIRDIGGIKAPAYGQSDKVIDEAMGKTTGIIGDAGIGADGLPAKPRLDRMGRKHGGATKKGC